MASAWADSWGTSWGNSWGDVGVAAVATTVQPTGGWWFFNQYEVYRRQKKEREEERQKVFKGLKGLAPVDREIARYLHKDEQRAERERQLSELERLVKRTMNSMEATEIRNYGTRVAKAYTRAVMQGNYSALEAFDREFERALEEEEYALMALLLLE